MEVGKPVQEGAVGPSFQLPRATRVVQVSGQVAPITFVEPRHEMQGVALPVPTRAPSVGGGGP